MTRFKITGETVRNQQHVLFQPMAVTPPLVTKWDSLSLSFRHLLRSPRFHCSSWLNVLPPPRHLRPYIPCFSTESAGHSASAASWRPNLAFLACKTAVTPARPSPLELRKGCSVGALYGDSFLCPTRQEKTQLFRAERRRPGRLGSTPPARRARPPRCEHAH